MEYYRIGEFAKQCGTTVEFLKYYDREGLISPVWRDEAGYRYYARYQMVHFAEFYTLLRMGFSSKEAKHIHDNCSLEELESSLVNHRNNLIAEISDRQSALTYLEGLLTAAIRIRQRDRWYIHYVPDTYFGIHLKNNHPEHGEPWWKSGPSLPEIWQRVEINPNPQGLEEASIQARSWGTLLSEPESGENGRYDSVIPVPGGRCFQYWHSVPAQYDEPSHRLSDKVWDLSEPLSIMKRHNLTPRGDLYQRRLFVTQEKTGKFVHIMTQIPLK